MPQSQWLRPKIQVSEDGRWNESWVDGLQNNKCHFVTVQCGLKSIELKAEAGALVLNIEIEIGANAGHLGHGPASAGLCTSGCWHCHGYFCR
jgi:hypothetical protein